MQSKTFYYHFDWLNAWFVLNAVLLVMLIYIGCCCPRLYFWPQTQVLIGVLIFSLAMWYFKCIHKHVMAVVTDESIKIDHTNPLFWRDVAYAEEREIWCCLKKRKILVLVPKDGTDYKYNFLQKHNGDFTPFSIPLYGVLKPEDEKALCDIVFAHVKHKD